MQPINYCYRATYSRPVKQLIQHCGKEAAMVTTIFIGLTTHCAAKDYGLRPTERRNGLRHGVWPVDKSWPTGECHRACGRVVLACGPQLSNKVMENASPAAVLKNAAAAMFEKVKMAVRRRHSKMPVWRWCSSRDIDLYSRNCCEHFIIAEQTCRSGGTAR